MNVAKNLEVREAVVNRTHGNIYCASCRAPVFPKSMYLAVSHNQGPRQAMCVFCVRAGKTPKN